MANSEVQAIEVLEELPAVLHRRDGTLSDCTIPVGSVGTAEIDGPTGHVSVTVRGEGRKAVALAKGSQLRWFAEGEGPLVEIRPGVWVRR